MSGAKITFQPHATKVLEDPRIPLRIQWVKLADLDGDALVERYEAGDVVVVEDFAAKLDLPFLRSLPVWIDGDKRIKKAKLKDIQAPLTAANFRSHFLAQLFPRDFGTAARFRDNAARFTDQMQALALQLFPHYRFTGVESHSWRLVESYAEELHVDSYNGSDDEQARVRLFFNYDDAPRIWHVSLSAPELLRSGWDQFDLKSRADDHPNELNAAINARIPWHEAPRHTLFFAPGTLWLADTQLVSHEIVWGRRGAAYTYGVDPASLRDPASSFQARMRAEVAARRQSPTLGEAVHDYLEKQP